MKNLKRLSWDVAEEVYRADEAVSYSDLSFFERKGFRALPDLKKKVDASYFRSGSLVDCLLTESETFYDKFYVSNVSRPSETIAKIVESLLEKTKYKYKSLITIPDDIILDEVNNEKYYLNWKDETRIDHIKEKGGEFYKSLIESQGKTIVDTKDTSLARATVEELRTNRYTSKYFIKNPYKNTDHLYQLKFKVPYGKRFIRCMFDEILVNHDDKSITPIDLKTTGKDEDLFEDSFIMFKYFLQGTYYTYILKKAIANDEYFKDFKVLDYKFIVINKFNNTPIVWNFNLNHHEGDYIHDNKIIRGWKNIYEDLIFHLENKEFKYPKEMIDFGEVQIRNILLAPNQGRQKQELDLA